MHMCIYESVRTTIYRSEKVKSYLKTREIYLDKKTGPVHR